jgi:hypothetical protein
LAISPVYIKGLAETFVAAIESKLELLLGLRRIFGGAFCLSAPSVQHGMAFSNFAEDLQIAQ